MDVQERILEIEKEIRETPYHKGTEHHIGLLRARLARLEEQVLERQTKKGGGGGGGFAVKKVGDATVVLVGLPSVGKSTLLNALTNAKSQVAPYSFTTVTVIPGMMRYRGAEIQIMDVPGLIEGAAKGRGRGREVLSVIRGADLVIFITEVGKEEWFAKIEDELFNAGVRINKKRPEIKIKKKPKGGIEIRGTRQNIGEDTLASIFHEFGLKTAEIMIKEKMDLEELIDALSQNRVFVPAIYVINKMDLGSHLVGRKLNNAIFLSAKAGIGLDELREAIWDKLEMIRIYLAKPAGQVDYEEPLIMKSGSTLKDVVEKLGRAVGLVTHARISGPGSKFPNQQVSLSFPIVDEMVVSFQN